MNATIKQWGNNDEIGLPVELLENSDLRLDDNVEIIPFKGGFTLQKKNRKTWDDIAEPLIDTKGWKFDREEANARR